MRLIRDFRTSALYFDAYLFCRHLFITLVIINDKTIKDTLYNQADSFSLMNSVLTKSGAVLIEFEQAVLGSGTNFITHLPIIIKLIQNIKA